jgi:uncharacterized protein YrrD
MKPNRRSAMLATYTSTIGKAVLDSDQGEVIGTVTGLLLDPGYNTVGAVILSGGKAIRLDAIHSFGRDAIMVDPTKRRDDAENRSLVDQFTKVGSVVKKKIIARDGEEVGIVDDVLFDCFSGELQLFVVSGGALQKLMLGGPNYLVAEFVQTIGPDHIIAKGGAADAIIKEYSGLERVFKRIQGALTVAKER